VHATTEDRSDDTKDSYYEELDCVLYQFPKYHMKILLHFNSKVRREDIFKPTIGNESLIEINNDAGARVVNFASSRSLIVKIKMSPHYKFS
jgi:hypothetical protein